MDFSLLLTLFLTFFKIGLFTFGGGYAMLPLVQAEIPARGWLTEEGLIDFIAVSESSPGPFAVNIATYVGTETAGLAGAVAATLGVVLPSFLIILLVAKGYEKFRENRLTRGVLTGLRPAVVGLIGAAILTVALTVFLPAGFTAVDWALFGVSVVIFGVSLALLFGAKLHPIAVIAVSAALGVASGFLVK